MKSRDDPGSDGTINHDQQESFVAFESLRGRRSAVESHMPTREKIIFGPKSLYRSAQSFSWKVQSRIPKMLIGTVRFP